MSKTWAKRSYKENLYKENQERVVPGNWVKKNKWANESMKMGIKDLLLGLVTDIWWTIIIEDRHNFHVLSYPNQCSIDNSPLLKRGIEKWNRG